MDGNAARVDSCHSGRGNYGKAFIHIGFNVTKKGGLTRSGFPGQEDGPVGLFNKFENELVERLKLHRFKDTELYYRPERVLVNTATMICPIPFQNISCVTCYKLYYAYKLASIA